MIYDLFLTEKQITKFIYYDIHIYNEYSNQFHTKMLVMLSSQHSTGENRTGIYLWTDEIQQFLNSRR